MSSDNQLFKHATKDGSITLRSKEYKESFHSDDGARKEAMEKYIYPSDIKRFREKRLKILDVCFGMGYNTACLLDKIEKEEIFISWWGLEIDKLPLKISLNSYKFSNLYSSSTIKKLTSIETNGGWNDYKGEGFMLWGDARQKLNNIPSSINFDLIFLDAFSPSKCPELWTEEFLTSLVSKLKFDGRLLTYSSAAAIRATLLRQNLELFSLKTENQKEGEWSKGTIAVKKRNLEQSTILPNNYSRKLSIKEREHLKTKAAIPYRDKTSTDGRLQIIDRRSKEQHESCLEKTIVWRRRWNQAIGQSRQ